MYLLNMWQPGPSITLASSQVYSYTHKNNGLRLLLCPVEGTDICGYMRAVCAGSKDESGTVPMGSAHFIEHMSFRIQKGKIWSLASKGDVINAETNMDSTRFFVVHLPHQTEETIRIDSERYKQASVPEDKVPVELHAVLNELERGQRAGAHMFRTTSAIGILEHPYHHSTIGTRFDVSSTTAKDMEHFRAKYYVPNNTTLIFCGAFDPAEVQKHVDTHFGKIPRAPDLHKASTPEPPQTGRRTAELRVHAQCPMLCMAFRQPQGSTHESIVLQCISRLVWHKNQGRAVHLVNDGTVHDVSTYAPRQENPYLWFMHATLDNVEKLDSAEQKLLHVLQSFVTHPVSESTLHAVKTSLHDDWKRSLESVTDMMNELGRGVSMGNWKDCVDRRLALESVRPEDIAYVAQHVFQPTQMTVTRVIPTSNIPSIIKPTPMAAAPVETSPATPPSASMSGRWDIVPIATGTNILHVPRASYVRVTLSARFSPAQHDTATLFVGSMKAARNEPDLANMHTERDFSHDHEFLHMTMDMPTKKNVLDKASDLYFQRQWLNPSLKKNIDIQKQHMIAELNASQKDQAYLTKMHFICSLFEQTMYHVPIRVRTERIRNMTTSHLQEFHSRWIKKAPTMVTIVAPSVDTASFVHAKLPSSDSVPATTLEWTPTTRAAHQKHVVLPGYGSFQIMMGQTVPVKQYSRAAIALECATHILGGGMTGRLMRTVRVERGLGTYGLYAVMQYVSPKTDGIFCIQGTFSPTSIHEGLAATKELLACWIGGVREDELARAKEHMIGSRVIAMDSVDHLHGMVLQYLMHQKSPRAAMQAYRETVDSLTLAEVNKTLRALINVDAMSEVVVGPTSI